MFGKKKYKWSISCVTDAYEHDIQREIIDGCVNLK